MVPVSHHENSTDLAEYLASMCEGHRHEANGSWRARCPAHNGASDDSLHITPAHDSVVLHCFGGCHNEAIVQEWGLTLADLFTSPRVQTNGTTNGLGRIVKEYDYHDAAGTVLYQTVRKEPKEFYQRQPHPSRPGDWLNTITDPPVTRVLYRLPHILAAMRDGHRVWICEGEKDTETLVSLGLHATTAAGGASAKWLDSYSEVVKGAHVVLTEDNDAAGHKRVQAVASALHGMAASVKVLSFSELPAKGDVSDWIAQGHTRADLEARAEKTPAWEPPAAMHQKPVVHRVPPVKMPVIVTMDTVTAKPVEWFWWPYLALGTLAMLDGDPGIGKTMLTSQLAANTSKGWPFPNQQGQPEGTSKPGHSLFLAREDSLVYTVRKRLDDIRADVSKIHYLTGWRNAEDEEQAFTLDDMEVLYHALDQYHPRLVVLDPIQSYLGAKVDMHRANETRPLLDKLTVAAEKYHCLIICVRHPAKASGQGGGKAMLRGLGSVDFIGAARTGLFIEEHPTDKTLALMAMSKSNIGAKGRTQIFSKADGVFSWAGVTRMDAEILAGTGRGPDPQAFFEAYLWLEKRLDGGIPVPAKDIEAQAEHDLDISLKVLKRAKKALGVVSRKIADGIWMWTLPALSILGPQEIQGLQGLQGLQGPLQHLSPQVEHSSLEDSPYREEVPIGQESQEDQEVLVDPVVYRADFATRTASSFFCLTCQAEQPVVPHGKGYLCLTCDNFCTEGEVAP